MIATILLFACRCSEPTVGIIVNVSLSEQDSIPKEREAVRHFLENIMPPGDRAFLATTATRTRLVRFRVLNLAVEASAAGRH
jgi:hypothetical protein